MGQRDATPHPLPNPSGAVERVSWIGVGKLGMEMCLRLTALGTRLTVTSRSAERAARLQEAGADVAPTIAELCARADVVATCLPDDPALIEVVAGPGGIAQHLRARAVLIDFSTVAPATSAEVSAMLAAPRINYLRCPVSGTVDAALHGELSLFCSGPADEYARMEALLSRVAARRMYCGAQEEARFLKLAINLVAIGVPALLAEALQLGQAAGLDRAMMVDALCQSAVASPQLRAKAELLMTGRTLPAQSTVDSAAKDARLITTVGGERQADFPMLGLIRDKLDRLQAAGRGNEDYFALTDALGVHSDTSDDQY